MKIYESSSGNLKVKADNITNAFDVIEKEIVRADTKYRSIISNLCMWIEGAYIVLEKGNTETFMQTFPYYKKHMIDYLEGEGYDTSMFTFAIKDDERKAE